MAVRHRTWRDVDGERIEGTWRHVFIHNGGTYHLTDLFVYADGMVDCWELVTLDEFATKLASGWVATELPDGARASAHHLGSWTLAEPNIGLTPEMLLGEVRDDIDQLKGRPDSTDRCLTALDVFRAEPTEDHRAALREAYDAVPAHLRRYALGDQNNKDMPLRVLIAGPGNELDRSGEIVTEERHARALEYFADTERWRRASRTPADGRTAPAQNSIYIEYSVYFPRGWPEDPGTLVLRNEFPAPITVGEQTYPSVTHAYWASAVVDGEQRAAVLRAETPYEAMKIAENATLRTGWPQARTAVMARLLRLKFSQHPDLARTLAATGTTRLIYVDFESFWGQYRETGRNWVGRLLELIRSELAASDVNL